jgi:PPOX class probable F420-dependent enzyme
MSRKKLEQFINQQYINLETFRKNGTGVKTPVWFVQDQEVLYVWTQVESWKAKRIRNNNKVKVTPSKVNGEPLGEWVYARARTNDSENALNYTRYLMRKKYGLVFRAFDLMGNLGKSKNTSIKIEFME